MVALAEVGVVSVSDYPSGVGPPYDEALTPERAVRLLRARASDLEDRLRGAVEMEVDGLSDLDELAAHVALIARLLADHIDRGHA